jgi:hypothetical protein
LTPERREPLVNALLALALLAAPLIAVALDEPFYVTLASRVAILALAGVGLNLALGTGGMVSFGHAAFFGLGGYAAGIAALHAFEGSAFLTWPFEIGGTESMAVVWLAALAVTAVVALAIGAVSLRTSGVYFILITLAEHTLDHAVRGAQRRDPAHDDHQVVHRVHVDHVVARTQMVERLLRRARQRATSRVQEEVHEAVRRLHRRRRRREIDPALRQDLPLAPAPAPQREQTEARHVLRADEHAAAPMRTAAHGLHERAVEHDP